ncbi:MAG: hypothetical protein ABIR67_14900 [Gaiellaceae bacterium]
MRFRGLLVFIAAALVFVPGAATAPAQATPLMGTVGPGFTITLADAAGRLVTQLDPGTYEIAVRDLSDEHNFRLFGPGVEEATQVETTGTVTWTVTFREGRYTIQCDPHSTQMVRTFTVGNPPPVTTPKPPPPAAPRLLATVGPRNTISLRSGSGAVLRHGVKAGTYSVVVRDRSKVHNFHLVGKNVNRRSTLAGIGTSTWRLKLSTGVLRFYSDRAPRTVRGSVPVN